MEARQRPQVFKLSQEEAARSGYLIPDCEAFFAIHRRILGERVLAIEGLPEASRSFHQHGFSRKVK